MKKSNQNAVVILLLCVLGSIASFSQESREDPRVQCRVSTKTVDGVLNYDYKLTNLSDAKKILGVFEVEIAKNAGGAEIGVEGIVSGDRVISMITTQETSLLVPVGLRVPLGWIGGLSSHGTAYWAAVDDSADIRFGQTLEGFRIESRGLPGPRQAMTRPDVDILTIPVEPPSDEPVDMERYRAQVAEYGKALTVAETTIGPIAPPLNFIPSDFVKVIKNYLEFAVSKGWVHELGLLQSLRVKLDTVEKALNEGRPQTAQNVLAAFVHEVDAQTEKQLSFEAGALLKFNGQYLANKM